MSQPVTSIRNLGAAMAEAFAKVGITTADELRDLGTDAAYARLLAAGARPHFIAYYAIEMGLKGRPWNDCTGDEKTALRQRFDALKANRKSTAPEGIEKILDELGVRPATPRAS
ncbi:MAG: TfoX/Sxy family DNA transformation protein [Pseudomonadota bacterium]